MAPTPGNSSSSNTTTNNEDELAVQQQSTSALLKAKRNFSFLISPNTTTDRPIRLRTRALLRTIRYIGQFLIWRLVKWAKYAAVGALIAAVGATAFGGAVSGVAWIAAPPTIGASIIAASVWGVGRFVATRLHRRWVEKGREKGELEEQEKEEREERSPLKWEGTLGGELGPRAVPW